MYKLELSAEIVIRVIIALISLRLFPWQVCFVCGLMALLLESASSTLNLVSNENSKLSVTPSAATLIAFITVFGGPILLALYLLYWKDEIM